MKPLPPALLSSLSSVTGLDQEAFKEAHTKPSSTSIRIHPKKPAAIAFDMDKKVPWCNEGFYLSERPLFTTDPLFHAGGYYVQEASSMFLNHAIKQLFSQRTHLRVLDLCAAPGGKSTLLASLLEENSLLVSNEVIRTRASILEENVVRWGYTNNWVTSNDPKDFHTLSGYFDLIVIDAPCSGSGLFRKDQKALDNWSMDNVALCAARQKRILADVWNSLKENGILIYATCSYSPEENEELLDWVYEEFEATGIRISLENDWNIVESFSQKQLAGYRFFPDKVCGEGFFLAAIRKNEASSAPKFPKSRFSSTEKIKQLSQSVLAENDWSFLERDNGAYKAIKKEHEQDYLLLKNTLYLRKTGVDIGTFTAKEWIPDHEIAMSLDRHKDLAIKEVDKATALRFLKKEDIGSMELPKGWYLVAYEGLALGWIKSIGNRSNNYLPKHWRIRMELPPEDQA